MRTFTPNFKPAILAVLLLCSLVYSCKPFQETTINAEPGIRLKESTGKVTAYEMTYPKYRLIEQKTPQGVFQRFNPKDLQRQNFLFGNEYASMAEVPMYTALVALPLNTGPENISIELGKPQTIQNVKLYPIQQEAYTSSENPGEFPFKFDKDVYYKGVIKADEWKEVTHIMSRPYNIYRISIPAVDYEPEKELLRIYEKIRIRISHPAEKLCFAEFHRSSKFRMDDVDTYLNSAIDNRLDYVINKAIVNKYRCPSDIFPALLGAQLLIVTTEDFYPAAADLKLHKESLGIRTRIVKIEDILAELGIGSGTLITDVQLKNWIVNYNSESIIKLKWLLLIGDAEFIPTHYISIVSNGSKCSGDQYYGQLSGGEPSIPSIGIGRLPIDSLTQAQRIVQRIKDYELSPPNSSNSYYGYMGFAAEFQDDEPDGTANRWFAETSEDIRNHLIGENYNVRRIYKTRDNVTPEYWHDGTSIPHYLKKPGFPWDGDRQDVIDVFNAGAIIVYHRDHGSKYGWGTPGFGMSDLDNISISNNEYPFVFSINCASGVFDNETANLPQNVDTRMNVAVDAVYWAEKLIIQKDGAIGIVGDTRNSSTVMNNLMAKGLFDAMFPAYQSFGSNTPIYRMGDILNHAKSYIANSSYSANSILKENTIYNLFGDPSLKIIPKAPWIIVPDRWLFEREILKFWYKVQKPECLSCPAFSKLRGQYIIATLINPKTGEVISRTLANKKGEVSFNVKNYKGDGIIRLNGPNINPISYEVKL